MTADFMIDSMWVTFPIAASWNLIKPHDQQAVSDMVI